MIQALIQLRAWLQSHGFNVGHYKLIVEVDGWEHLRETYAAFLQSQSPTTTNIGTGPEFTVAGVRVEFRQSPRCPTCGK